MGNYLKYFIQMVLGSILVFALTVFLFTDRSILRSSTNADDAVDVSTLADGVYAGEGNGFAGPITVEVTVASGEMTDIKVLSHGETDGISDPAFDQIPANMIADNTTVVDVVSGATGTSGGLIEAVNNALGNTPGEASEEVAEEPVVEEEVLTVDPSTVADGTYTATVDGHNAPLTVEVTVAGGVLTEVIVTEHGETEGLSDPAISDVPAAMIENNSTEVDTISGATVSSKAIIKAVNTALENAN